MLPHLTFSVLALLALKVSVQVAMENGNIFSSDFKLPSLHAGGCACENHQVAVLYVVLVRTLSLSRERE